MPGVGRVPILGVDHRAAPVERRRPLRRSRWPGSPRPQPHRGFRRGRRSHSGRRRRPGPLTGRTGRTGRSDRRGLVSDISAAIQVNRRPQVADDFDHTHSYARAHSSVLFCSSVGALVAACGGGGGGRSRTSPTTCGHGPRSGDARLRPFGLPTVVGQPGGDRFDQRLADHVPRGRWDRRLGAPHQPDDPRPPPRPPRPTGRLRRGPPVVAARAGRSPPTSPPPWPSPPTGGCSSPSGPGRSGCSRTASRRCSPRSSTVTTEPGGGYSERGLLGLADRPELHPEPLRVRLLLRRRLQPPATSIRWTDCGGVGTRRQDHHHAALGRRTAATRAAGWRSVPTASCT